MRHCRKYQLSKIPHSCAQAHMYMHEFSKENSKLKASHYFSGAFKLSLKCGIGAVSKVGYFLDSLSSLKLSLYIIMT